MTIEDLLSPYRGFKPSPEDDLEVPQARSKRRATAARHCAELPSPESWEMYEFVQDMTGDDTGGTAVGTVGDTAGTSRGT